MSPDSPGARIRHIRQRKGITLSELAGCIGIRPGTLGQYERGAKPLPPRQREQIAVALRIDLDALQSPQAEAVTAEERALLASFRRLPEGSRAGVCRAIAALVPAGGSP